jgi:predicted ribosomally synthesized peptide with SipW-like signal peptide
MKKKVILFCAAATMAAALAAAGTLAYLTDQTDEATNTFAIGSVEGALTENGDASEEVVTGLAGGEKDNVYIDWDSEGTVTASGIAPGQKVQKKPVVTNTGLNAAYVRLTVTGVDFTTGATNSALLYTPVGLNVGAGDTEWTYYDGKFYYNSALPADDALATDEVEDATAALFTAVQLKPWVTGGGGEDGALPSIAVYAELIQANYLDIETPGTSLTDAINAFTLYE